MWIDSHCHLTHERIRDLGSPETLITEAKEQGVDGMVTISCQITGDFPAQLQVAQNNDNVWCSIGTHPHDSGQDAEQAITQAELVSMANSDPNIVAIGESGLDYYYDNSPRDLQAISFRKHMRACIETGLPLIVHTRDADTNTMNMMIEEAGGSDNPKGLTGVMHCFSSGADLARKALDFGFYVSFSGIVTFKKATELQNIAKSVPLDRILVETDAPFLAPTPYRGKTNHPAYVVKTGEFLADLHGISPEDMARITKENFFNLFKKAKLAS
jgi:TatD DNase family protein